MSAKRKTQPRKKNPSGEQEAVSSRVLKPCDCEPRWTPGIEAIVAAADIATEELLETENVLSVLRNAGWELWFRNLLLLGLEKKTHSSVGFTEAWAGPGRKKKNNKKRAARRADLLFRCLECGNVHFGIEVKINYAAQGKATVHERIKGARVQTAHLIKSGIPVFLVYAIAELWYDAKSGPDNFITKHNELVKTAKYKGFRPKKQFVVEDLHDLLPAPDNMASVWRNANPGHPALQGSAHGEVAVFVNQFRPKAG